ncbi:SPFH domain-containing protein [Methylotuvimicrobium alcaliphilum]|uniref:Virion core protein (Lumpy skin disease virus)-like protein n=1 Tax=Methylotuvimicrobium alcaliphilum (strain DSM 19304 / NCIMB 14124 / VKM B-2133 / 20Z) TaxID=1091494 RepID=G4STZ8_META2|nr:SPFH domain-containing protein [Methylotuvimicrobium alcaliphilum]CCE22821.1 putative virion core protein (Lumpy skin disease virus)-like protein [Methylotuvimicrobium alcaliphilum 20Z]
MGFWNKLFGEFVDVIEWTDSSSDTMVYRFERYGNEIKYGAMLTVRESQTAILVSEGRVADFYEPGLYQLETRNMPILTTLESWPHGFKSPFKAEVYFFNMRRFTDLKWGTKNPIMLRDKEFGPLRLRAFGTYSVRINEPLAFIKEIVGTGGHFRTDDISSQLRNLIVSRFSDIIGESGIPALDLAANYDELGAYITERIAPEFSEYGLEVLQLLVENISLPPEVENALDKRTSMGIIGDLHRYTQFQAAEAMAAAAQNPSGGASEGIGMGMGFAVARELGKSLSEQPSAQQATPPPIPTSTAYFVAIAGHQEGPYELKVIEQKVRSGEINRDTLVWSAGMAQWKQAGQVPEFSAAFVHVPPPLPG